MTLRSFTGRGGRPAARRAGFDATVNGYCVQSLENSALLAAAWFFGPGAELSITRDYALTSTYATAIIRVWAVPRTATQASSTSCLPRPNPAGGGDAR